MIPTASLRSRPRRSLPLALLVCVAVVAGLALWLLASRSSSSSADRTVSEASLSAFAEETGVRIVRVALIGGGGIVDLRYQVLDPDTAEVVHDSSPVLVDETTNEVIDTFFMGHNHGARNRHEAGVTYPLLYVNEQGLIDRGSAVSVVIGDSLLEHVVVR